MLLKGVLTHVQVELVVKVSKKDLSKMVAFAYDYCILVAQVVERCKRGAEHGVCAHKGVTASSVKLRETALDRSYVRYNAAHSLVSYQLDREAYQDILDGDDNYARDILNYMFEKESR